MDAYLALEPYVRRNWPQTLISWTKPALRPHQRFHRRPGRPHRMLSAVVIAMLTQCSNLWEHRARRTCRKPMRSSEFEEHLGPFCSRCLLRAKTRSSSCFCCTCCAPCCATSGLPPRLFTAVFLPPPEFSSSHLLLDLTAASLAWESRQSCCFAGVRWRSHAALFYATLTRVPITTHTGAWYYGSAIWMLVLLVAMRRGHCARR